MPCPHSTGGSICIHDGMSRIPLENVCTINETLHPIIILQPVELNWNYIYMYVWMLKLIYRCIYFWLMWRLKLNWFRVNLTICTCTFGNRHNWSKGYNAQGIHRLLISRNSSQLTLKLKISCVGGKICFLSLSTQTNSAMKTCSLHHFCTLIFFTQYMSTYGVLTWPFILLWHLLLVLDLLQFLHFKPYTHPVWWKGKHWNMHYMAFFSLFIKLPGYFLTIQIIVQQILDDIWELRISSIVTKI